MKNVRGTYSCIDNVKINAPQNKDENNPVKIVKEYVRGTSHTPSDCKRFQEQEKQSPTE
jgi:hypothetical protein